MAIYTLDNVDPAAGGGTPQPEKKGYWEQLLDDMAQHYMHTNDAGSIGSMRGWYNVEQEMAGNGQPMLDSQTEVLDYKNNRRAGMTFADLISQYNSGEISASDLQRIVAEKGIYMTPNQETWLNNILSKEATKDDQDYQRDMRDTSVKSTADQLSQLGLNPGSVVGMGGASSGVSSSAAKVEKSQFAAMQFQRKTEMAKTMIHLAAGLASSSIHGAGLGAARFAASKLTADASRYATDQRYAHMQSKYFDLKNGFINTWYD